MHRFFFSSGAWRSGSNFNDQWKEECGVLTGRGACLVAAKRGFGEKSCFAKPVGI